MQYQCCRERRSRYILRLARFLAQLGDFDQALQALNRVVTETQMAKANIELLRGDIFSQRGELESALETWKRVVELPVPSSPDAALTIAKATAYINLGDPGQAARLLDEIKSPEVALRGDYWLARAMSLFVANREPESVLSAAEHALQIFGRQNYLMRLIRAGALTRLGRSKGALADLNHLVAEVPRFAQCQTQLLRGHALIALDAFIDALAAFRTAEATAPDEFTRMCAEVGVGLAQVSLGRREEALPSLKAAALTSDDLPAGLPYRWLAWWALGTVYAGNGSNEQALAAFAHASAIEPRNADIQIAQGKIHARLEDFEAALRCFQVAFDSALEDGNRKEAFLGQGGALLKLERHEEAIAAYRSALGLASENGTVWQALGEAYAADGRHNAALQAFRRAYRLARSEPGKSLPSAPALGVSAQLLALEKNQEASQFLDRARYKVASDAKLDFNNGIALTRLRRYREAIEAFRRAGDMQGATDQVEALEARGSRGRFWFDVWFGANATPLLRVGGISILVLSALFMGLMLLNPHKIAGLAWLDTTDAWKAMVVLMLILLLPSLEGLKWGGIEIKLAPAEVSPEIHVAPIDPTSALEVVLRSVRTALSPVAFTRAPTTASRGTAVTGVVDLAKATLITTTRNGQP